MIKKILLGMLLLLVVITSGCINLTINGAAEDTSSVIPSSSLGINNDFDTPTQPLTQRISGVNRYVDVSGDIIQISGVENTINIIEGGIIYISGVENIVNIFDIDVKEIHISGVDILVTYPKNARPIIQDSGVRTIIRHSTN